MSGNNLSRLEIESMIFGIIKTLEMIHNKAESGIITPEKYHDYVLESISRIEQLSNIISSKGLSFNDILLEMNLSESLYHIIGWIKEAVLNKDAKSLNSPGISEPTRRFNSSKAPNMVSKTEFNLRSNDNKYHQHSNKWENSNPSIYPRNPIASAKLSAQITADFITILDYFKLGLTDLSILKSQFIHLYENLGKFPNMEEISVEISMIIKEIYDNADNNRSFQYIQNKNIPKRMEELYKEFKLILFKLSS